MSKQKKNRKFDFITLVLSVLAGLLWAVLGRTLIRQLYFQIWTPLVIGLYFYGLALMLIFATWLCTVIKGRLMPERGSYLKAFALTLAIFVLAGAFQWIYSLDFHLQRTASGDSAYVFLVDESGSMEDNDPTNQRAKAIEELLEKRDRNFPFAVYGFSTEPRQIRDVLPASKARGSELKFLANGLTNIYQALNTVVTDIDSGYLAVGSRPHIILITDGISTDSTYPLHEVLNYANNVNARISTVSVGDAVDEDYLTNIAIKTGGNYVKCKDISELQTGMMDVTSLETTTNYQRTLLNVREKMNLDWIYMIMRILFLLILAVPFMLIKSLLLRTNDVEANVLIPNLILTLIGALSVEIGMNHYMFSFFKEPIVHSFLCIGFTILIVTELAYKTGKMDDWDDRGFGFSNRLDSDRFNTGDDDGFD